MDSMYDRLGDLLSNALESGDIPEKKDGNVPGKESRVAAVSPAEKTAGPSSGQKAKNKTRLTAAQLQSTIKEPGRGEIIRAADAARIPEQVSRAFETLGTAPGASEAEIKKAYREKLKLFHPDENASNETIQKIAKEKTAEIIEAFALADGWTHSRH